MFKNPLSFFFSLCVTDVSFSNTWKQNKEQKAAPSSKFSVTLKSVLFGHVNPCITVDYFVFIIDPFWEKWCLANWRSTTFCFLHVSRQDFHWRTGLCYVQFPQTVDSLRASKSRKEKRNDQRPWRMTLSCHIAARIVQVACWRMLKQDLLALVVLPNFVEKNLSTTPNPSLPNTTRYFNRSVVASERVPVENLFVSSSWGRLRTRH